MARIFACVIEVPEDILLNVVLKSRQNVDDQRGMIAQCGTETVILGFAKILMLGNGAEKCHQRSNNNHVSSASLSLIEL